MLTEPDRVTMLDPWCTDRSRYWRLDLPCGHVEYRRTKRWHDGEGWVTREPPKRVRCGACAIDRKRWPHGN